MNKFKECNQCLHEFNDKTLEPCKDCAPKKKNNGDRVRAMSDEELAKFLDDTIQASAENLFSCDGRECTECDKCYLEWLQSEAE